MKEIGLGRGVDLFDFVDYKVMIINCFFFFCSCFVFEGLCWGFV